MTDYKLHTPDRWVIVEVTPPAPEKPHRKVFAGWIGNYTNGDSWRLSSPIRLIELYEGKGYDIYTEDGAHYKCSLQSQEMSGYMGYIYNQLLRAAAEEHATLKIVGEYR
jgi:hypothetical protein